MHVPSIIKQAQGLITTNGPAILTGVGVVGVVGTAYLTGKATFKAADVLQVEQNRRTIEGLENYSDEDLSVKEKTLLVWQLYLPAVGVASTTIVAIIYANRINAKRMAALLTAYTAADRTYKEYEEKVKEHLTGPKEQKIRDEIAADKAKGITRSTRGLINTGGGDTLCVEALTGRPFLSSMESIKEAVNNVNNSLNRFGEVSLSDLYNQLGLPNTKVSDNLGWRSDKLIEFSPSTQLSDDGEPLLVMDFREDAFPNFYSAH